MNRIHVLVVFLIALLRCALVPASAERDLETGTFLTRDPAGFVDGPNLYNYVGQNPWSRFDPDGLAQEFLDGTKVSYNQQSGYYVVERGSSIGPGPVNHAAANWMLNRGSSNPAVVDRHLRSIQKYDPYTIGAAMGDPVAQALLMGGGLPGGVERDSNGKTISPQQAGVRRYSGGARVSTHEADTQNPGGKSAKTTRAEAADVGEWKGATDYSTLKNPKDTINNTKPTSRQVREMKEANRAQNDGVLKDDVTGEPMIDSAKSQKGVTPPTNEAQVDHMIPQSKGGTRSFDNLQLRTRQNNRAKSDSMPDGS